MSIEYDTPSAKRYTWGDCAGYATAKVFDLGNPMSLNRVTEKLNEYDQENFRLRNQLARMPVYVAFAKGEPVPHEAVADDIIRQDRLIENGYKLSMGTKMWVRR